MALPPFDTEGTQLTEACALLAIALTVVGALGTVGVPDAGADANTWNCNAELTVTNEPPALAQGMPGAGTNVSPIQPCATAVFTTRPVAEGVPVKLSVAVIPGGRSPIEQLNAPAFVLAHRSGFPPGPNNAVIVIPGGAVLPSWMPLAMVGLVFVTLVVKVVGWFTTAGPPVIWVTCSDPGVVMLSAIAGAARGTLPRTASARMRHLAIFSVPRQIPGADMS
jgi:hypothetical protein